MALTPKLDRDERLRNQYFPDSGGKVFNAKTGGFVPLPIVMRKVMGKLGHAEFRALVYLHLRASRQGICYPPMDDMVRELGLKSKKHLLPALETLERKCFISTHRARGRIFFLVHDLRVAIRQMRDAGEMTEDEVMEIDDLLTDLKLPPIELGDP